MAADGEFLPLEVEPLLEEAKRRAGSSDFGSLWFREAMAVQLKSMREEADLSPAGRRVQTDRIVNGLVNRLRLFDAINKHPEIMKEKVHVAGVILGLPRSGSTMLHRLIGNAPGNTAIKWWETQNPSPFPGEKQGDPAPRRKAAQDILDYMIAHMPDLMSIHPMSLDEPDEEIIVMDQTFLSTMAESYMWIPTFVRYFEKADMHHSYQDLKTYLKFFQWQDPGRKGKQWFLKTPGHLAAPQTVLDTFPEATFLMTHREPTRCVPSYCSMVASLYTSTSNHVDFKKIGQHWAYRWSSMLRRLVEIREKNPALDAKFVDIMYKDLTKDPIAMAKTIYGRIGRPFNAETETAMRAWFARNGRDNRPTHQYDLEKFGLSEAQLERDFDFYWGRLRRGS